MPKIEDIKVPLKKFKKSNYRPWNFLDELEKEQGTLSPEETMEQELNKIPSKKVVTNWEQTDNKPVTNRKQTDNKVVTDIQQTGNKVVSQPVTEVVTNWKQTGNNVLGNLTFSSLVGLQRSILIFLYQECKKSRSKVTTVNVRIYCRAHAG